MACIEAQIVVMTRRWGVIHCFDRFVVTKCELLNEGLVEELVGLWSGGNEEEDVIRWMDNVECGNGVVGGAVHDYVGVVGVVLLLPLWIEDVVEAWVLRPAICTLMCWTDRLVWHTRVNNRRRASLASVVRVGCHGVVLVLE